MICEGDVVRWRGDEAMLEAEVGRPPGWICGIPASRRHDPENKS